METRICKYCGIEKEVREFRTNKKCQVCYKKRMKPYIAKPGKSTLRDRVRYGDGGREKSLQQRRLYGAKYHAKYYAKNQEKCLFKSKSYYNKNKEKCLSYGRSYGRSYRIDNKEKIKLSRAEYYKNNRDTMSARHRLYYYKNQKRLVKDKIAKNKKRRELLDDHYIIERLLSIGFDRADITPEIIELARARIIIKRTIKNKQGVTL